MLLRKIPENELDQEDARILRKIARLPEKVRTGKHAQVLKERYWDRLFRPTSLELFQLLVGEITSDQVKPSVRFAFRKLIESVAFERTRYLNELRARTRHQRRFS